VDRQKLITGINRGREYVLIGFPFLRLHTNDIRDKKKKARNSFFDLSGYAPINI